MPNWNYNSVTIGAPIDEVQQYLVYPKGKKHAVFNMHLLYPEVFSRNDKAWDKAWDYNWAVEHTGSKWFPTIHHIESTKDNMTLLVFDTAWEPNNKLLEKLHQVTGWYLVNSYEEPGCEFEGVFYCQENSCTDIRWPFRPTCSICWNRKPQSQISCDDNDLLVCTECQSEQS